MTYRELITFWEGSPFIEPKGLIMKPQALESIASYYIGLASVGKCHTSRDIKRKGKERYAIMIPDRGVY